MLYTDIKGRVSKVGGDENFKPDKLEDVDNVEVEEEEEEVVVVVSEVDDGEESLVTGTVVVLWDELLLLEETAGFLDGLGEVAEVLDLLQDAAVVGACSCRDGVELLCEVVPLADRLEELGVTVESCSWISIMWSPRRIVRFRGALPDRKSFTCNKNKLSM